MSERKTESPRSKRRRLTLRLTTDAMLVAVYVVLASFASIPLEFPGIQLQLSLSSLPILLCAFLFGFVDTFAVSLVGSFLEQVLSPYGLAPNAPIWMAPVILFGMVACLGVWLCRNWPNTWQRVVIVTVSELIFTLANTGAEILDAFIYQYPVQTLAVLLPVRLLAALLRMVITAVLIVLLLDPIRKIIGGKRSDNRQPSKRRDTETPGKEG